MTGANAYRNRRSLSERFFLALKRDKFLFLMALPGFLLLIVFKYVPIYGVAIAFQNYRVGHGFLEGPWVGLKHFAKFVEGPYFGRTMWNTLYLGILSLVWGFPLPILLALCLNEFKNGAFKKTAQTVSYLPYFISTVILIGMLKDMMAVDTGLINDIIAFFGGERINFFSEARWFRTIYVGSGVWQGLGYSSIIYLAALSGVSPELYESATIDGATRFQKMRSISLPCIMPTVAVLFILAVGGIMGNDFQKILLIYSPATYSTSDVISTYVYRMGIEKSQYSFSAAVGLFSNAISFVFLVSANTISKKFSDNSLW